MGAGKEAPGAVEGAAEPPPPVVLKMVLHCAGCAKKVRNSIKSMPGVQSVVADAAANRVVVAGTADAAALKARIESRTKKPVEIVSSGAGPGPAKPAAAPAAAEKKSPDKEGDKKDPDKGGGGADKGDKAGASKPQPPKEEDAAKKQPPTPTEEKKPTELQVGTQHTQQILPPRNTLPPTTTPVPPTSRLTISPLRFLFRRRPRCCSRSASTATAAPTASDAGYTK
uniref:HMA domain-containing protein n=1 Tax=Triticum urartu TaxID=4572 RepID=A0A8R7RDS5_TRIUA